MHKLQNAQKRSLNQIWELSYPPFVWYWDNSIILRPFLLFLSPFWHILWTEQQCSDSLTQSHPPITHLAFLLWFLELQCRVWTEKGNSYTHGWRKTPNVMLHYSNDIGMVNHLVNIMPKEPSEQKNSLAGAGGGRFFRSRERHVWYAREGYGGVKCYPEPKICWLWSNKGFKTLK